MNMRQDSLKEARGSRENRGRLAHSFLVSPAGKGNFSLEGSVCRGEWGGLDGTQSPKTVGWRNSPARGSKGWFSEHATVGEEYRVP